MTQPQPIHDDTQATITFVGQRLGLCPGYKVKRCQDCGELILVDGLLLAYARNHQAIPFLVCAECNDA